MQVSWDAIVWSAANSCATDSLCFHLRIEIDGVGALRDFEDVGPGADLWDAARSFVPPRRAGLSAPELADLQSVVAAPSLWTFLREGAPCPALLDRSDLEQVSVAPAAAPALVKSIAGCVDEVPPEPRIAPLFGAVVRIWTSHFHP